MPKFENDLKFYNKKTIEESSRIQNLRKDLSALFYDVVLKKYCVCFKSHNFTSTESIQSNGIRKDNIILTKICIDNDILKMYS